MLNLCSIGWYKRGCLLFPSMCWNSSRRAGTAALRSLSVTQLRLRLGTTLKATVRSPAESASSEVPIAGDA